MGLVYFNPIYKKYIESEKINDNKQTIHYYLLEC